MNMREPVRLVIWDLDDTFWKGTVTEGGIAAYLQESHEIVKELNRRGIMNSICSKNEFRTIEKILTDNGIWDQFIFPSIDWTAKPERIAAIIEAVQLRPASVLFIDDNPSNRAAAKERLPDLQVEAETFIPHLLADRRFVGKDDRSLSRLAQYRLLEKRRSDQTAAAGDNTEFLRRSGIRVTIESDIARHVDRAVELINRTNQLNFTKIRLPEDPEAARAALLEEIDDRNVICGLVHVADNYGDYGYCGFFMIVNTLIGTIRLKHFCFSCRILGFGVEQWIFKMLGAPLITVVGDVLGSLDARTEIDWINADPPKNGGSPAARDATRNGNVVIRGQCDPEYLAKYFNFEFKNVFTEQTRHLDYLHFRGDSAFNLDAVRRASHDRRIEAQLARLGFDTRLTRTRIFESDPDAKLVLFLPGDFRGRTYRHKETGVRLFFHLRDFGEDLCACPDDKILNHLNKIRVPQQDVARIFSLIVTVRNEYVSSRPAHEDVYAAQVEALGSIVANTSGQIYLVLPSAYGMHEGKLEVNHSGARLRKAITEVRARRNHRNLHLVDTDDAIEHESDRADRVHLSRIAYYRLAKIIMSKFDERDHQTSANGASRLVMA